MTRRTWPTWKEREAELQFNKRMAAERAAYNDAHTAKHGPHTCTPDPADPWSTCHLEKGIS